MSLNFPTSEEGNYWGGGEGGGQGQRDRQKMECKWVEGERDTERERENGVRSGFSYKKKLLNAPCTC